MKLLQLNIEGDRHLDAVAGLLEKEVPDVVCLEEASRNALGIFKERFGLDGAYVPMLIDREGNVIGVALLSRRPLRDVRVHYYWKGAEALEPGASIAGPGRYHSVLLLGKAEIDDDQFSIGVTHFPVNYPGTNVSDFQRSCYAKLKELLQQENDLVFAGDTNCPRGTEIFDDIAKNFKDNIPADAVTTIDRDLHKAGFLPYVVDCLFTTPQYEAQSVRLQGGVSDHLAVIADIHRVSVRD